MHLFKFFSLLFSLLMTTTIYSQSNKLYQLSNEQVVFSFQTKDGKIMSLNIDTNLNYIIYRFGTKNQVELEYPREKNKSSFEKFEYAFYFRPLQDGVDGIELQQIRFKNGNVFYTIYQNVFFTIDSVYEKSIGVKLEEIENNQTTDIKGINSTQKGSIGYFSGKDLLNENDISED